MTKQYAVIGDPIKHSKSPQMHNAAFAALGLDAQYSAIHVKVEDIPEFVERARKELCGFNVTVPHKYEIIPYLDEISESSKIAGSVNTVSIRDGKLYGDTTDGFGLETGIKEAFDIDISGRSVCFVGCGGAVQAVATHFAVQGVKKMFFVNRTVSKAQTLIDTLADHFKVEMNCCAPADVDTIAEFIKQADILVQGTSLGLNESDPAPIDLSALTKDICVYDSIYKHTALLQYAEKNGNPFSDGRSMLLHQGAKSFSIWTGVDAPVEVMREALFGAK